MLTFMTVVVAAAVGLLLLFVWRTKGGVSQWIAASILVAVFALAWWLAYEIAGDWFPYPPTTHISTPAIRWWK